MGEAVDDARDLVRELFPDARWAVLAGSVITEARTAGSDLDIVVVANGDAGLPYRQSLTYRGWPVELFVHDGQTLVHYLAKDLPTRRPALHRMVATGIPVVGADDPDGQRQRERCAAVLAAGPAPLSPDELERARYSLTDALDDLCHVVDAGERVVMTTSTWLYCAELALGLGRHWTGTGKWLLRELRDFDPDFAARWLAAAGDAVQVTDLAHAVLATAGGSLFAGYRAAGDRPPPSAPTP